MLGSLISYLKGMRMRMFQLSGFYLKTAHTGSSSHPGLAVHGENGPAASFPRQRKWSLRSRRYGGLGVCEAFEGLGV